MLEEQVLLAAVQRATDRIIEPSGRRSHIHPGRDAVLIPTIASAPAVDPRYHAAADTGA